MTRIVKVGDTATVQVAINQLVISLWLNNPVPSDLFGYKLYILHRTINNMDSNVKKKDRGEGLAGGESSADYMISESEGESKSS